jgi:threonine synthase
VLTHRLATDTVLDRGDDPNPFVRHRESLYAWHAARARGVGDAEFVGLVRRLDDAIAAVDGHGFRATPYTRQPALGERLGLNVWVKDETGNVAGSHKARHLMGLALYLAVAEGASKPPLAIASCGNAALAAGVIARAIGRELQVFVPPSAEPAVMDRLHALGATVVACPRAPGERGDPCVHRFHQALRAGALPFCCQGNENGLAIDGGETLVHEMLAAGAPPLDHLVVQVGGGALASACMQAFARAQAGGLLAHAPRIHTVQTRGAAPLQRAWARLEAQRGGVARAEDALRHAATHRSAFMWPWEEAPHSIAEGILDDETYDWLAVLRGMAATGGAAVVADEATLEEANRVGRESTGIPVSHTGSAGLAGLMCLRRDGVIASGARVGVLFTGVQR